ncbi:amino acid transporter [Corynebacterium sp. H130]|uniref:amino acid transporter n=1 Tax=Corynebacterium sp. H130 TaxID=3133444 RepID=UPI0030AEA5E1
MCLTGLDYYSTLGYAPGIALVAAGALAPLATIILVAITMFGAVPVYRRIARESPNGQGSITVLQRFIPGWKGKFAVLILLGFAATDFMITMTLSAADASAHLLRTTESPWMLPLTLGMLAALAGVFYKGFSEAIRIAVILVTTYLALNAVVIGRGLWEILQHPELISQWKNALVTQYPNPWGMALLAVIIFPKLALGMSGFETGVAVIPQIASKDGVKGRIKADRKLLLVAASIMSVYLMASSIVTTVLIPAEAATQGGEADGRALAYLSHMYLGEVFSTGYDLVTVAILWFAGASAMAGILNLIPRWLPRYGMAPAWVSRNRPMVLIVAALAFFITIVFKASVEKQAGAYATGVLVLLTSGAVAVTLSARWDMRHNDGKRWKFLAYGTIALVFIYTMITNMIERPEGLHVAMWFIVGIVVTSMASRAHRAFEIRTTTFHYDRAANNMINAAGCGRRMAIVAHRAGDFTVEDYEYKEHKIRSRNLIPPHQPVIFLEVGLRDASEFATPLKIKGHSVGEVSVLRTEATAIPNAIAAIALDIFEHHDVEMDLYFEWSPGSPFRDMVRFLFVGRGQNAALVHEIIRRKYPAGKSRPHVHVG